MPTDSPFGIYGCHGLEADADNVLVYPTHTHVRIVGNKRTKASLTGKNGIVIKTVGLGGWHWLELRDGSIVKVQRNALCLAEEMISDDTMDEDSTPSERSSTHGCPEVCSVVTSGGIHLHKLSTAALMRYAHVHGLDMGLCITRAMLLKHVWWHFESLALDESSVLTSLTEKRP